MAAKIKSFTQVVPMIYAYNTLGVSYNDGWTKIGYTEKQTVEQRIKQQTHTAGIKTKIAWSDNAMYKDSSGEYFKDRDFHNYLVVHKDVIRRPDTEWFKIDGPNSQMMFNEFASRKVIKEDAGLNYTLREEQEDAVQITSKAFKYDGIKEFLWNAKPRFGKTLSSYDLIQEMRLNNVLIVTNRPSIANSWLDDFNKFIGWKGEYLFVSETEALNKKKNVLSYKEFQRTRPQYGETATKKMIAFESLQGLKGSAYFGGSFDKLKWIKETEFDLLIVDESQEGVDTFKTEQAFKSIRRKYTLFLSGTPFKQLASDQFNEDQIYNWSYADEQEKKRLWDKEEYNPYENLPQLNMFTYQISPMIYDELSKGVDITEGYTTEYAFDLNEFFKTNESGKFIHEQEVIKFLDSLSTNEKYPYSTEELRNELSHTLWIFNRVDSVKAIAKLLKKHPVFNEYEVVIAAGDGRLDEDEAQEKAFDKVKKAIAEHDKTITLSVGQLTVGVTIPEWSGVLMLANLSSPAAYMQAAFRAQNPYTFKKDYKTYRKENAYIFDFDPSRTLMIFDEFANNLSIHTASGEGTSEDRKENIRKLLNFFPVLGEDSEGKMVELDPEAVLTIPNKLKSQEVVRHGFMSNFLFQNIGNIFSAPAAVRSIIDKLNPAQEEKKKKNTDTLDKMNEIDVDDEGNAVVDNQIIIGKTQDLFGNKVFEDLEQVANSVGETLTNNDAVKESIDSLATSIKETLKDSVLEPVFDDYGSSNSVKSKIEKEMNNEVDKMIKTQVSDYYQSNRIAEIDYNKALEEADTEQEVERAKKTYEDTLSQNLNSLNSSLQTEIQEISKNKPTKVIEQLEVAKIEDEKKTVEDSIRDHLRGFSRTIPSFLMAYGDENLTLANIDDYTEDDVFKAVTGITEENFRFLRDGGEYTDEETGETKYFPGQLFNEGVFNSSVQEFLRKKNELSNYFDESLTEDIFDYIPPQKTNQIYTPKKVVKMMVDQLEENNPGCFDDPNHTFADLYMKSGLYITEIVKRLFNSEKMKEIYPVDNDRIEHILNHQVYGMAPTRIIYLIATNFILGFNEEMKVNTKNFVQADAAEAAKNGTLQELVDKYFDK